MHIILGVSPVSVGPCMCAVRTQVTEDRPLKSAIAQPAQHRTSPAQDKAILSCHWNAAGVAQLVQRTANLTVARGQGRAASTASNGGAGRYSYPVYGGTTQVGGKATSPVHPIPCNAGESREGEIREGERTKHDLLTTCLQV